MKTGILALALLVLAADRSPPPPEDRAQAEFTKAAKEAEAAYRESVLGAMRVEGTRLEDAERSAVRKGEIAEANRIRRERNRLGHLAAEVAQHDFLGGVLPGFDKDLAAYEKALADARADAAGPIGDARKLAVEAGDLDAANRVQAVEDAIAEEIEVRLTPLIWQEFPFAEPNTRNLFTFGQPEAWRIQDGELIGTEREGEELTAMINRNYRRISAVTVVGRIVPPSATNFRLSVGPVNAIFNWERAAESHFRYHEKRTVVRRNLLVPGREHEITVRQLTKRSVEVTVDGSRVWIEHGTLSGTVTVYPMQSSIGVREIRVLGVPGEREIKVHPSHRRW